MPSIANPEVARFVNLVTLIAFVFFLLGFVTGVIVATRNIEHLEQSCQKNH